MRCAMFCLLKTRSRRDWDEEDDILKICISVNEIRKYLGV